MTFKTQYLKRQGELDTFHRSKHQIQNGKEENMVWRLSRYGFATYIDDSYSLCSPKPSMPCLLYSKFDQIDVSWRTRTIHNTGLFGCASGSSQHEHSRQIAYYSKSQVTTHNSYIIIFKLGLSFPIIRRYWYKSSDQFLFICFWFTIDFSWRISTPKFRFF